MRPDIIYNMPFGTYADMPAINKSGLDNIRKSPLHFRGSLQLPHRETPALRAGHLIHAATLEPERFDEEFVLAPEVNKRTKAGKKEWNDFIAGLTCDYVTATERCAAINIRDAVWGHNDARSIISQDGPAEVTAVGYDVETLLFRKCRPDKWVLNAGGLGVLVDLKSTSDATPRGFAKSCANYRYHVQAAYYLDTVELALNQTGDTTTPRPKDFVFIAVEKEPPLAVGVYRLSDKAINLGRVLYRQDLNKLSECMQNHTWPGPTQQIQELDLPAWAYKQNEVAA